MHREFPSNADLLEGNDRREFIKIMGASFALAGMGLAACRRIPETHIVPYSSRPANRTPGRPVEYASAVEIGGVGNGVLVRSFDGRPINLSGNPNHPVTMGGCEAVVQANVLQVYDPERSRFVMQGKSKKDAETFRSFATKRFQEDHRKNGGAGIAVLADVTASPSQQRMQGEFMKAFPKARWFEWLATSNDNELEGTRMAFGAPQRVHPELKNADIIVCLDADPLMNHPAAAQLSRGWADGRRIDNPDPAKQTMNRMYSVEGVLTVTGMSADNRIAMNSMDISRVAAAIAAGVGMSGGKLASAAEELDLTEHQTKVVEAIISDLNSHKGRSVVLAGDRQPAEVHALVAAINQHLGNAGKTVLYMAEEHGNRMKDMAALVKAMNSGQVESLVILGANPVYDAPVDLDFPAAMGNVKDSIHLSLYNNQTSQLCTWQLPSAHWLEAWGDVRAWDGTRSITQPTIMPMIPDAQVGWSAIELLAELADVEPRDGYSIVRATELERSRTEGATFERHWRTVLDRGIIDDTAWPIGSPTLNMGKVISDFDPGKAMAKDELEFVMPADSRIGDGRYANNGWLQELPDAVTKVTWDNTLSMSPVLTHARGLKLGDMVKVTVRNRTVEAAVFPVPGMAEQTVALSLGWGQTAEAGSIAADAGFNAYQVRTTAKPDIVPGIRIEPTGKKYLFAHTQDHGTADAIMPSIPEQGVQERLPTLVREASLDEYQHHPDFAKHAVHVAHRLSLWEESNMDGAKFRWAMSIDLNTCTGCGACVTACQAEHNIPVVGKDQVMRGREMHWIRVDRYFKGDNPSEPDAAFIQPVTCMQCENAPCEQVCPVAATVHDHDGLNVMVYNRCIGTRYCSNNCPYKVRRFNWFDYWRREPVREQEGIFAVKADYYTKDGPDEWRRMQMNPDVTVRTRGVMEKCSFCTQRISEAKIHYKNEWARKGGTAYSPDWNIPDGGVSTACEAACSTGAIVFGDLNVPNSRVSKMQAQKRSYELLEELNTKPRLKYMALVRNPGVKVESDHGGHGGHGDDHGGDHGNHGDGHGGEAKNSDGHAVSKDAAKREGSLA